MKRSFIYHLLLLGFVFGFVQAQKGNKKDSSVLYNIESKIHTSLAFAFEQKDITQLNAMQRALYAERVNHSDNVGLYNYWLSYIDYFKTVVFMHDEPELASDMVDEGIKRLKDSVLSRNSEDQALLGMLLALSITFHPGIRASVIQNEIEARCKKSVELDSENPRPYYVLGSSDFYTAAMFGGGKKCEKYLLQALERPAQRIANPYLPSWGREGAYELLIKYYLDMKKQPEKAREYFKRAHKEYPNSYLINQLAPRLIE